MGQRAYTQLHSASHNGDLPAVKELLQKGRNPNHFDEGGCTPLHYAAAANHIEVAKALLAAGAKVNAQDEGVIGDTPLAHSAQTCSLEMAQLLIAAGADPSIPGWMQNTALTRAARRKRGDGPKVYQLLCSAAKNKQVR
jgi:ankyrin repeat protein